ncbi:Uncharacterized protein FWK35_00006161 [Aphis craccivora]|uniref:Uncharacterized protein n=1 Tax=Aphis craccivora TaxID=307492 RepID=A0A6G0Z488_APHCR|nr:Uncharacterized protein FWK35_00006161 [Aphis craccivora]
MNIFLLRYLLIVVLMNFVNLNEVINVFSIDFIMIGGFRWQSKYPWYIIEVKIKNFPTVLKKNQQHFVLQNISSAYTLNI